MEFTGASHRAIPPGYVCHDFWPFIEKYMWYFFWDVFGIRFDILLVIFSDILFDFLRPLFPDSIWYLFWHFSNILPTWHLFWHSILAFYLALILAFFLAFCFEFYLGFYNRASFLPFSLACVEARLCHLRPGAGRKEGQEAILIKPRGPHLAGGEKWQIQRGICLATSWPILGARLKRMQAVFFQNRRQSSRKPR